MPIDPSILQGIQPVQAPSILDTYAQIAQLQDRKAAGEERRAAAQEKAAIRAQEAHYAEILQRATRLDPEGRPTIDMPTLMGAGAPPDLVFAAQKTLDETMTRLATLRTSTLTAKQKATQYLGAMGAVVKEAGYNPDVYGPALVAAKAAGALTAEEFDHLLHEATVDETAIQRNSDAAIQAAAVTAQPETGFTLSAGQTRFGAGGQVVASVPAAPKPDTAPAVGSFEDYVVRRFGPTPTPAQITQARKDYQQADDRPTVTVNTGAGADDVKAIVQGMIDGTLPPQLPGRASPAYNAIMAEAQRRGYNLAGAVTDWVATQKHTATLNGAQQLRLNQAVNALPEMLDSVERLAKQWKAGRFPVLNRASLAAAKHGVYGAQAATIANQLDAQIADVVADLGNVYMGGNSPTDHALGLAAKSLNSEWSEQVLLDMVALAKKNVQIRRNSINSTGVAGASEGNPYAPTAPTGEVQGGGRGGGVPGLTYQDYLKSRGK